MSKSIKQWLSEESIEASRKSKMWASGKRVDAISKDELNDLQWWRLEMIDLLNILKPNSVSGKVLEIGAGQGIASAYLTSFKTVDNVYAIDYSKEACKRIVETSSQFKNAVPSKLHVIHGSYDDIKETNYDLIVAFGAIHNSPDFSITFKSLYNKLANNGKLLISDMCLTFIATSNDEDWATDRIVPNSINKYGDKLRYRDTNDYFRSIFDYLFHSKEAGFRIYPILWDPKSKNKLTNLEKDVNGLFPKNFIPISSRGRFDPILLICEKDNNINKNCLPSISPKYSLTHKLLNNNYLIRIIKIFIKFGFKNGLLMIASKIKKRLND
ncbi:MAG: hypothetical protein CMK44_00150 [Porticoccus sp.]|nr:hypothetical protein [Porticoccus sp.]